MKRCLLITPLSFYNWHIAISKELNFRGYSVDLMNDEYPEGILGILIGKFLNSVSQKITLSRLKNYFKDNSKKYDLVIIFKGRGVSYELLKLLKLHSNRVMAYNFDSFDFFSHPLKWMRNVDSYKTFDFIDSEKYHIQRVDLFSDRALEIIPAKTIDLSCIIKNHSDRLVYLDRIYNALHKDYKFEIYIYETNVLTLIRNLFQHPLLIYKWWSHIYFKGLSEANFFDVLARSKFTLDYAHPKQTGITMRCFQAAAAGTIVITNNTYIANTDQLNANNYFIYQLEDDIQKLNVFIKSKINSKTVVTYRGISSFVDELLL